MHSNLDAVKEIFDEEMAVSFDTNIIHILGYYIEEKFFVSLFGDFGVL